VFLNIFFRNHHYFVLVWKETFFIVTQQQLMILFFIKDEYAKYNVMFKDSYAACYSTFINKFYASCFWFSFYFIIRSVQKHDIPTFFVLYLCCIGETVLYDLLRILAWQKPHTLHWPTDCCYFVNPLEKCFETTWKNIFHIKKQG